MSKTYTDCEECRSEIDVDNGVTCNSCVTSIKADRDTYQEEVERLNGRIDDLETQVRNLKNIISTCTTCAGTYAAQQL